MSSLSFSLKGDSLVNQSKIFGDSPDICLFGKVSNNLLTLINDIDLFKNQDQTYSFSQDQINNVCGLNLTSKEYKKLINSFCLLKITIKTKNKKGILSVINYVTENDGVFQIKTTEFFNFLLKNNVLQNRKIQKIQNRSLMYQKNYIQKTPPLSLIA